MVFRGLRSLVGAGLVAIAGALPFATREAIADNIRIVNSNAGQPDVGGSEMFLSHNVGGKLGHDSGDRYWSNVAPPGSPDDWLRIYSDQVNQVRNRDDRKQRVDNRPYSDRPEEEEYTNQNFPLRLDTQYQTTGGPGGLLTSSNNYIRLSVRVDGVDEERPFYSWSANLSNGAEFEDGTTEKSGLWDILNSPIFYDSGLQGDAYYHELPKYHITDTQGLYGEIDVLPLSELPAPTSHKVTINNQAYNGGSVVTNVPHGSSLELLVSESPHPIDEFERRRVDGAEVVGNAFEQTSPSGLTIGNVTNETVVSWNWLPQYWYTATANGNATLEGTTNGWHDLGELITTRARPADYHRFVKWGGTTNSTENPLSIVLYEPHSVEANVTEKLSSQGTHQKWYANHGITEGLETADDIDHDGDGYIGRKEYIWGTNPNDKTSYPRIGFELHQGNPRIEIHETTDRSNYIVFERPRLTSGGWDPRTNVIGRADGGPVTLDMQRGKDGASFYRVGAELIE
jgi:hypothetical protein